MTEIEVHPKKYYDQIEVFGSREKRSWSEGFDEFGRNKLRGEQTWIKKNHPELLEMEAYEPPSEPPRRCSINEPNCPVRNPFDSIEGVMREEGIKLFDNLVWQSWHEDGNMPKEAKEWFDERVKEFKAGRDIDLVCNCRRFRGQDHDIGLLAKYPRDCHGYTLKKYIEFMANE